MSRECRLLALSMAALVATLSGCDVPFPETTSPDCRVTALHQRVLSLVRSQAIVFVIDPELGRSLDDARRDALLEALVRSVSMLVTGDIDADGERDFSTYEVLRVAVITADGAEVSGGPLSPVLTDLGARPIGEGFIEVWPGEDATWDAWFVEAARAQFTAALAAPAPERATPLVAALTFAGAHPDFVDLGWRPMVAIVGGRDDESVDTATVQAWSEGFDPAIWGLGIVAGVLPSHIPSAGAAPDFDVLLARPDVDDDDVRCADGARVGIFPRRLVGLARELSAAGAAISLDSLCAPTAAFVDPIIAQIAEGRRWACLPRALPTRLDGTVECRFEVTLPASGRGSRCADHGLRALGVVPDARGRPRERCELPVVPRADIESVPGFYYDDFTADLADTCGATPHRLALTPVTQLPGGTEHEWWCAHGTAECGLELATEREPLDGGRD